jgi:hypothetical protein
MLRFPQTPLRSQLRPTRHLQQLPLLTRTPLKPLRRRRSAMLRQRLML